ncbi:unnamed protein product, partial [Ascophyllum nodosum]
MCSCLQVLRRGIPCRHTVAALVTELKRADEFKGESIHPRWRSSLQPWSIEGVGLSDFNGHERGPYSGGFTGDLEGNDCGEEQGTSANNSSASVTGGRFLANLIEMASRGARTLVDSHEKKVLSSDCSIFFATLNGDIDAYVKRAASSVGTGGLSGIGNPPMPVTKSRRESRFKDCA